MIFLNLIICVFLKSGNKAEQYFLRSILQIFLTSGKKHYQATEVVSEIATSFHSSPRHSALLSIGWLIGSPVDFAITGTPSQQVHNLGYLPRFCLARQLLFSRWSMREYWDAPHQRGWGHKGTPCPPPLATPLAGLEGKRKKLNNGRTKPQVTILERCL